MAGSSGGAEPSTGRRRRRSSRTTTTRTSSAGSRSSSRGCRTTPSRGGPGSSCAGSRSGERHGLDPGSRRRGARRLRASATLAPIVVGGLWNGIDKPLLGRRAVRQRQGHPTRLHVAAWATSSCSSTATTRVGVALISADGKLKISLNATKNQIHIAAENEVLIEAKKIEIKAETDAAIEAKNISLKASGEIKIKGAKVALN